MLKVALKEMMAKLDQERRQTGTARLTVQEIHQVTGIHRKILSRLLNHPEENTSSEHVDKLTQFFFNEFRQLDPELDSQELMRKVTADLIQVYPDEEHVWAAVGVNDATAERFSIPPSAFWKLYQMQSDPIQASKWWEAEKERRRELNRKALESKGATVDYSKGKDKTSR